MYSVINTNRKCSCYNLTEEGEGFDAPTILIDVDDNYLWVELDRPMTQVVVVYAHENETDLIDEVWQS